MKPISRFSFIALTVPSALLILSAPAAFASLERTIPWSAQYAAQGGVTGSISQGSQSLFFNPAGLAGTEGTEATINFSPTLVQFKGPISGGGAQLDTGNQFVPIPEISASYGFSKQFTVGVGFGAMGGSRADYNAVDFSAISGDPLLTYKPDLKLSFQILELSLGGAYEVLPGLKIGAAWRIDMVNGNYSLPSVGAGGLTVFDLTDISATKYSGFRFGAMYTSEDKKWGLGVDWRTSLDIVATGTSSAKNQALTGGAVNTVPGGGPGGTLETTFPNQFTVGGHYATSPDFRLAADLVVTEYVVDRTLEVGGVLPGGVTAISVPLNWTTTWSGRLGGQYTGIPTWALRAGYDITNSDVPKDRALNTNIAPGLSHGFTIGAGKMLLADAMSVDAAFEYTWVSATGTAYATPTMPGEYFSRAIAFHVGTTYRF